MMLESSCRWIVICTQVEILFQTITNPSNSNGKLLEDLLKNNPSLFLANGSDKCEGDITRLMIKGKKVEKAILDFVLVSKDLKPFLLKLKIDANREFPLSSFLKGKQNNSDHFTLNVKFDIKFRKQKPERVKLFRFKSIEGMIKYKNILNTENNLNKCFKNNEDCDCETQVKN